MPRLAAIRFLLLIVAAAGYGYLGWFGFQSLANSPYGINMLAAQPCKHPFSGEISAPGIVSQSESIVVRLGLNAYGDPKFRPPGWKPTNTKSCAVQVELSAPNFDYEPARPNRTFDLAPVDETKYATWVVSPKKTGTQKLVLSSGLDTMVVTVTVISDLGLTARQSALVAAVSALIATVLALLTLREGIAKWLKAPSSRQPTRRRRKKP